MKCDQNVCLDEISDWFKNGSCWVKTRSLVQILEKPCVRSRSHIFSLIIMKIGQNVCHDEISDVVENGSGQVRSKARSVGKILENLVCALEATFSVRLS